MTRATSSWAYLWKDDMGKHIACIKACATSANLGPGFDRAGLALDLYNHYFLKGWSKDHSLVETRSQTAVDPGKSLVVSAAKAALARAGVHPKQGMTIEVAQNIPPGKGLGSSAADIIGGILLASKGYGLGLDTKTVFEIALEMEKHPDNIAAALSGGLAVCYRRGKGFDYTKISISPRIQCLVFIPDENVQTQRARRSIPQEIPLQDACDNIAHFCLLVHCLQKGDLTQASVFMKDKLVQEYRRSIYPASMETVDWLLERGIAAAISGSGPAVIALVDKQVDAQSLGSRFYGFKIKEMAVSFKGTHHA